MPGFREIRIPQFRRGYRGGYVPGFDTTDVDKALFLVQSIPALAAQAMQRAATEIATNARRRLKMYPGPPSYPLKWASRRQRAWYFATRKEKGLPIGYTRTSDAMSQRLRESWGITEMSQGGVTLGNSATYGPYVQSSQYQTEMHKATGWITDAQVIDEMRSEGDLSRAIENALGQAIRNMIAALGG